MQTEVSIQTELVNQSERVAADSMACDLFSPELMLPAQFNVLNRSAYYPDGERRLMVAVLDTALRDYLANAHPRTAEQRMRFAEVSYWMNQQSERPRLFSFQWLCGALEIDANRLRRTLASLRRRGMSSRLSSIGAASSHYRSARKITASRTTSFSTRAQRRRSL
jgi:hypothetical protein